MGHSDLTYERQSERPIGVCLHITLCREIFSVPSLALHRMRLGSRMAILPIPNESSPNFECIVRQEVELPIACSHAVRGIRARAFMQPLRPIGVCASNCQCAIMHG